MARNSAPHGDRATSSLPAALWLLALLTPVPVAVTSREWIWGRLALVDDWRAVYLGAVGRVLVPVGVVVASLPWLIRGP